MTDILPSELHPLEPFLPQNAKVLMLGSFPPPQNKWKMDFYYPNFQNDMWRIIGLIFFEDKDYFLTEDKKSFDKERIVAFMNRKGIAMSDSAIEVQRLKDNASDLYLNIIQKRDIKKLLQQIPLCKTMVTTGDKATKTLLSTFGADEKNIPPIGGSVTVVSEGNFYNVYRMPSTSRAYPKPLNEKALYYQAIFKELGMI